ncbi:MAG: carbamoyltransferase HypF, partial [Spirochaetaceae bacterium]|nr:carbamoyltransferase HypF [Spirochaetaceae bacterium]
CGPRFTIIKDRPYDRLYTSMSPFPMCSLCGDEYGNPENRRFHAQPNACSQCGPQLKLIHKDKTELAGNNAVHFTAQLLAKGQRAAIKGLGGFHFACDPLNESALSHLRKKKSRPHKSFALMMRDIEQIRKYCHVSAIEEEALLSISAPIVLLKKKNGKLDRVSPDNNYLGVMLPFTPLHHLLMKEIPLLIMTSANKRDEPLAIEDFTVISLMNEGFVDFILTHNREIINRCDDSIIQFVHGKIQFIRRSRGYVPHPVLIQSSSDKAILCMGGNLKNTFALRKGDKIFMSQHIGDLTDYLNYTYQKNQIEDFSRLIDIQPEETRCDAHPSYENYSTNSIHIYHHHAHMLSVMAEYNLRGSEYVGVICDGTGFGTDNSIWGFEFLKNSRDNKTFERIAHLNYFPLPGGEKAIREIDRIAIALTEDKEKLPFSNKRVTLIRNLIQSGINSPMTSSLGRLFDGMAAILGLVETVEYEARGAMILQREAESVINPPETGYATEIRVGERIITIEYRMLMKAVLTDILSDVEVPVIAWKFHKWISDSIISVLQHLSATKIILSGGCFQNTLLTTMVTKALIENDYDVYRNSIVPPNDGGIALGQAYF